MLNNHELENVVQNVKKNKPLVLNLTNFVTMDFMANTLLALGAAPIMSVCDSELEELVSISNSINLNIGTLDSDFIARCHQAVKLAKVYQKPIIFDPVGAGCSAIRTKTAQELMIHADIIRGNASEILALEKMHNQTLGVESRHTISETKQAARNLAKNLSNVIVVSGPVDFITDGTQEIELNVGSALMPLITGMGCTLTAVIAAFRGILNDSFESAKLATLYFGLCGNVTEKQTKLPGSFRTLFVDNIYDTFFDKNKSVIC